MAPRLIAFYLPQYHPIPENDEWWGKGFTEWTNVAKAKPLFKGHYQPHLPADLGFYDLRVPEVREQQADLARQAGIEGFCYWHYWFAGKRLLERPFNEVLQSGKPDFPFCLAWANESWTGIWHGAPERVLIEQTYPGEEDHRAHFQTLLPAFLDDRYIKVDGKPLFVIYRPGQLPDVKETLRYWNEMAISAGLDGIFFVGVTAKVENGTVYEELGFDATTIVTTGWSSAYNRSLLSRLFTRLMGRKAFVSTYQKLFKRPFHVYNFSDYLVRAVFEEPTDFVYLPGIIPNWDNSPRSGMNGHIGINSTPEKFKELILRACDRVKEYPDQHQIIFIKSWNEWAEGNYLEPDQKFGYGYLNVIKEVINHL
ncbi:MAG: glycoside hydrolase family 99-like domain-containing protein [Brevefilum sp.]|jgi:hypothetical protein